MSVLGYLQINQYWSSFYPVVIFEHIAHETKVIG